MQKEYFLVDRVLYFGNSHLAGRKCLVVPTNLHQEVLSEHQEMMVAGHFAQKKYCQLSQYYYWPRMRAALYKVCEPCVVCTSSQGQERPPLKNLSQLVSHLSG